MADYKWPAAEDRSLIGKRISRVDGPFKVSGRAKYTYDYNPKGLLYGKTLRSPYAKAKVVSIDTSAAEAMPGVKAVQIIQGPGSVVQWAGADVVAVAATDERIAGDALRAIKVQWQVLPHFVDDEKQPPSNEVQPPGPLSQQDIGQAMNNQAPLPQLIQQINQNGISFRPSEDDLKQMQGRVPQPLLDAIQKASVHEEAADAQRSPYKQSSETRGTPDSAFSGDVVISEGLYGNTVMTHCCMEAHGSASEWPDPDHLLVHMSTQSVSGMPGQMSDGLKGRGVTIPAANIRVEQQNIGGGFGSKFSADTWGIYTAQLSRKAGGAPVKVMLERDAELAVAGCRPSAFAKVKVAATKDGKLIAWQSEGWGTGGPAGGGSPPLPYIFEIPNQRKQYTGIATNIGPSRAWRAPNHPQGALITMGALDDLAAKLNMDPLQFFRKNIDLVTEARRRIYLEEFDVADKLMGWSSRWHPRPDKTAGPVKQGLGLSIHTWGGGGHASNCDININPDGSVDVKMGTQDLGTGTRTCILIVAADTLGIPMDQIKLAIGDSSLPTSGGSGGSTTIGGVSTSTRKAAVEARDALFEKVAPALGSSPDKLVAKDGKIFVQGAPSKGLTWKQACAKIGPMPIAAHGEKKQGADPLTSSGVGGVQMADVSVDIETGIVHVNKMVAVQDCGLVIDLKTAESQVLGALIMGVSYALYEEKIMDPTTGRMLNDNMEFYRLAGIGDIPEMQVHMMTGKGYDERGVVGLAEPPTVSPGACIANAVANAIGVRVPYLPHTPDRVLAALEMAEKGARA